MLLLQHQVRSNKEKTQLVTFSSYTYSQFKEEDRTSVQHIAMFPRFTVLPSLRNTAISVPSRPDKLLGHPIQLLQHISLNTDRDVGFSTANHVRTTPVRNFKTVSWRKRSIAIKNRLRLAETRYRKPGQIQAVSMPLSPQEMDNNTLVVLSQMGKH